MRKLPDNWISKETYLRLVEVNFDKVEEFATIRWTVNAVAWCWVILGRAAAFPLFVIEYLIATVMTICRIVNITGRYIFELPMPEKKKAPVMVYTADPSKIKMRSQIEKERCNDEI